ncbi:MAG: hypothetical protein EPN22_05230 [Nitrospirae bacterium]|nr:MAG: hypothetical protein EPN22_05230 [Nitrospirota bacterium]
MTGQCDNACCFDQLEFLVFCIAGISIGVDVTEIEALLKVEDAEAEGLKLTKFEELVAFTGRKPFYKEPRALVLKTGQAVIIEQPYDIISLDIGSIRPMPPLVNGARSSGALWGAAILKEEIIMLADLSGFGPVCA